MRVPSPFSDRGRGEQAGVDYGEVPPVPIPNTVVKLTGAENTWMATSREDRLMPALLRIDREIDPEPYSSIAQSVEHAAVNRRVVGSSPTWGAKRVISSEITLFFCNFSLLLLPFYYF